MYCPNCGNMVGDNINFCPNCGADVRIQESSEENNTVPDYEQSYQSIQPQTYSGYAIAGFVVSIVSLFINLWGIVGLVGFILSIVGFNDCKNSGKKGTGLAIAGIAVGALSIIYGILTIFLISALIVML